MFVQGTLLFIRLDAPRTATFFLFSTEAAGRINTVAAAAAAQENDRWPAGQ